MKFNPTVDNEKVYDEEIHPLMLLVLALCKAHGIPMVSVFQYSIGGHVINSLVAPGSSKKMDDLTQIANPEALTLTRVKAEA